MLLDMHATIFSCKLNSDQICHLQLKWQNEIWEKNSVFLIEEFYMIDIVCSAQYFVPVIKPSIDFTKHETHSDRFSLSFTKLIVYPTEVLEHIKNVLTDLSPQSPFRNLNHSLIFKDFLKSKNHFELPVGTLRCTSFSSQACFWAILTTPACKYLKKISRRNPCVVSELLQVRHCWPTTTWH